MIREYVYTIQEAAHLLAVNRETVKRWIEAGRLSGEKIGNVVLLQRWSVEMLKKERESQPRRRRRHQ